MFISYLLIRLGPTRSYRGSFDITSGSQDDVVPHNGVPLRKTGERTNKLLATSARRCRAFGAISGSIRGTTIVRIQASALSAPTKYSRVLGAVATVAAGSTIRAVEVRVHTGTVAVRVPRGTTAATKTLLILSGTLALTVLLRNN